MIHKNIGGSDRKGTLVDDFFKDFNYFESYDTKTKMAQYPKVIQMP